MMHRALTLLILCVAALLLHRPIEAAPPKVYTPSQNSAEYAQILQAIHGGEFAEMYKITLVNVARASRQRTIAYVEYEGPIGSAHAIMTQYGKGPWEDVWGEGDGGSDSCKAGAAHYTWAVKFIKGHGVKPDALFPGLTQQTNELKQQAKADPELQCVGDLDGGPKQ
jgi:hypothetical protein